jgi:hypothetical protein
MQFISPAQEHCGGHAAAADDGAYSCDLLAFISRKHIETVLEDCQVIATRLNNVKLQIQVIKQTFDARLSSKTSEDQEKLNAAVSWMTRITVIVMPMNLIAGFFGMNVPVPWQGQPSFHLNTTQLRAIFLTHLHPTLQTLTPPTPPPSHALSSAHSLPPASFSCCSPPQNGTIGDLASWPGARSERFSCSH